MNMSISFSIIFGLFDNSHGEWNMQDIKKVGLVIGLFTCIQKRYVFKIRHIHRYKVYTATYSCGKLLYTSSIVLIRKVAIMEWGNI